LHFLNLLISSEKLERKICILNCPILVRLILSFLEACKLPIHLLFPAIHANLTIWHLSTAVILNKLLQLFNSHILKLYIRLSLSIDAVISLQLLLQLNDSFISLVEPACQCNHDVSLLKQELLVSIYLLFVFLDLDPLLLNLLHFFIEFHSHNSLFFFQGISELREIFNLFTTNQNLRIHSLYLLFKYLFLFLFLHKLSRSHF
jgi:hypothetical protein